MDAEAGGLRGACGSLQRVKVSWSRGSIAVYVNSCTYPPSDDTILLLEAMETLRKEGRVYESALDLGTGSGALALGAVEILGVERVAAVDAYPCPALAARATLPPQALVAVCPYASCLKGGFDIALVNPPYLPEKPPPPGGQGCSPTLSEAWAGEGVMRGMLEAAGRLAGEVLAVYSSLSSVTPQEVLGAMGFSTRILASERFFMERLEVVHAWRS
ncbi:putative methyltransferase [Aeropyrum pernix]|uniref:Putative methyltransferase n=1 Tax=Aeropyrum pernix TaxID=56636 RepID=A0A401H800_AERPX|nr:class I SAM-dependent methyltransferase [Aeropyrum pernix]GBF08523.1 putative methyltransferase [Aeropyrum pernix]